MTSRSCTILASLVLLVGVSGTSQTPPATCDAMAFHENTYPNHRYSPEEALKNYDMAFYGEVIVPTKPCGLGYCAGIRVHKNIQGYKGKRNTIVTVKHKGDATCAEKVFATKGQKWVIFGARHLTKGGTPFIEASTDAPLFPAQQKPNFAKLNEEYFLLRARLDYAIDKKRSPDKKLR